MSEEINFKPKPGYSPYRGIMIFPPNSNMQFTAVFAHNGKFYNLAEYNKKHVQGLIDEALDTP